MLWESEKKIELQEGQHVPLAIKQALRLYEILSKNFKINSDAIEIRYCSKPDSVRLVFNTDNQVDMLELCFEQDGKIYVKKKYISKFSKEELNDFDIVLDTVERLYVSCYYPLKRTIIFDHINDLLDIIGKCPILGQLSALSDDLYRKFKIYPTSLVCYLHADKYNDEKSIDEHYRLALHYEYKDKSFDAGFISRITTTNEWFFGIHQKDQKTIHDNCSIELICLAFSKMINEVSPSNQVVKDNNKVIIELEKKDCEGVEELLWGLGLDYATACKMFFAKCKNEKGLPFKITLKE